MGGVFSEQVDSSPGENVTQSVLTWNDALERRRSSLSSTEAHQPPLDAVRSVKNPFIIQTDSVELALDRTLKFSYSSTSSTQIAAYKHCCPSGVQLSECTLPDQVSADWEIGGLLKLGSSADFVETVLHLNPSALRPLSPGGAVEAETIIMLVEVKPLTKTSEDDDWCQWYFMKFEPLASRVGWALGECVEKMRCGRQTFNILKIFTNKEKPEEEAACLVCQTAPSDTMVLPCRHLCLCQMCAEVVRARQAKCPICRGAVGYMIQLSKSTQPPSAVPSL